MMKFSLVNVISEYGKVEIRSLDRYEQ